MRLSLALSSDSDDAFMVWALRHERVPTEGLDFDLIADDIEVLNRKALVATYDLSAISMALYPQVKRDYWLMPIGASVGDRFGPAIVVRRDRQAVYTSHTDLSGKKVAVPGKNTTANLALRSLIDFEAIEIPFDQIPDAVRNGTVDGGVLIHEVQLICTESGLVQVGDLGELWWQKHELPLPLGGIVIRKSLGDDLIDKVTRIYRESMAYGLAHRVEALRDSRVGASAHLSDEQADHYIDRYVNENTLNLGPRTAAALELLFKQSGTPLMASDVIWGQEDRLP